MIECNIWCSNGRGTVWDLFMRQESRTYMFFDSESAWIDGDTEHLYGWEDICPCTAEWKHHELSDELLIFWEGILWGLRGLSHPSNSNRRIPEVEELVNPWYDHCPTNSQNPGTKSRHGHCWVVEIGHCGSYFWIWGVSFYSQTIPEHGVSKEKLQDNKKNKNPGSRSRCRYLDQRCHTFHSPD